MPSKREAGHQNLMRFEAWIAERDARGDWTEYLREGQIVRKAIAEACGFGRSALIQNPAIADLLRQTEERLARLDKSGNQRLARLESYVEEVLANDGRAMPVKDGRIDLAAVAEEIGMDGMARHLAEDIACRSVLNAAGDALGLPPVTTRDALDDRDRVAQDQVSRARAAASDYAKALAEREAVIVRLRRRIAQLEEQLAVRDDTGMIIRTDPIR